MSYYNTLILSGGCMKTISTLGSLQYCYETNLLSNIETYVGTSAGAMICFFLAIGYTPIEIITYLCVNNVFKDVVLDIRGMLNHTGAVSYAIVQDTLEKMTISKIGYLPTFTDIKNLFNKNLVITTYNFTKGELEYLNFDNTPTMPVLVALRMTSSLPLVFEPFEYMKNVYIDGGIVENFPLRYIAEVVPQTPDNPDKPVINTHHILGIIIEFNNHESEASDESPAPKNTMHDFNELNILEYIYKLLAIPLEQNLKYCLKEAEKNSDTDIIRIHSKINMFNFDLDTHDKLEYFSDGYNVALHYFIGNN
jgi:hypothetical protein